MALDFLIQLLVNGFIIGLLYGVVAMAFVLPICEPQSTGLFGDVFAMVQLLKWLYTLGVG